MGTPQEQAFQRWSIPDTGDEPRGQSIALAPTIRADSLEAVANIPAPPSSFRVYTPAEMKLAPMRRSSNHDLSGHARDGFNVPVLLKWTGIGILSGFAVLAALVLLLNFADDTGTHASASSRAAIAQNITPPALPVAPPPVQVTPNVDIGAAAAAPPPVAPKAKKKKTKKSPS